MDGTVTIELWLKNVLNFLELKIQEEDKLKIFQNENKEILKKENNIFNLWIPWFRIRISFVLNRLLHWLERAKFEESLNRLNKAIEACKIILDKLQISISDEEQKLKILQEAYNKTQSILNKEKEEENIIKQYPYISKDLVMTLLDEKTKTVSRLQILREILQLIQKKIYHLRVTETYIRYLLEYLNDMKYVIEKLQQGANLNVYLPKVKMNIDIINKYADYIEHFISVLKGINKSEKELFKELKKNIDEKRKLEKKKERIIIEMLEGKRKIFEFDK